MEPSLKPQHKKRRDNRIQTVYSRCLLTRKIVLPIITIGKNLKETIEENVKSTFEGKCAVEGYIKPNSTKILTNSSGIIERGNNIIFEVVFECDVCFPVEGMNISCVAKNITKAGIRAESYADVPSPIVAFLAKDHHYNNNHFSDIQEGDKINVRVIGQRFELNDKYISIIGELIKEKEIPQQQQQQKIKPRLVIEDE
jgi:DNA-directed RNA polymerase subunit E'/Rpb7